MTWYKRDIDAALNGMRTLTLEERGAYNTVLDLIYLHDDKLIDDDYYIAGWCRCDIRIWRRIKKSLFAKGKLETSPDGLLVNMRASSEVTEGLRRLDQLIEAGRTGGSKSRSKHNKINNIGEADAQANAEAKRNQKLNTYTITNTIRDDGGESATVDPPKPFNEGTIPKEANDLAERLAEIAGIGPPVHWPPGWCGAPLRAQKFLSDGWKPEIMLAVARDVMRRKTDGPPGSISYFENAFARAHARANAPLPVATGGTDGIVGDQNRYYSDRERGGGLARIARDALREIAETERNRSGG